MSGVWPEGEALLRAVGMRLYLRPLGVMPMGDCASICLARQLAGGPLSYTAVEIIVRVGAWVARRVLPPDAVLAWADGQGPVARARVAALLTALAAPRPRFAGLPLDAPLIMGIVNVTPDSFSDGGRWVDPAAAVDHMQALAEAGADIIDIGAELVRPGAVPVDAETEIRRLSPVLDRWSARSGPPLSVDTRHARTMRFARAAGAAIINDVSALTDDPEALAAVAETGAAVVLMHKRGQPATMNAEPVYESAPLNVFDDLESRVAACLAAGIRRDRIMVDPGIAFGKSTEHSLEILNRLALYHGLGCGILIGVSRKGLIGDFDEALPPPARLPGSLAATLAAFDQGAQAARVHDVAQTVQARAVWQALHG